MSEFERGSLMPPVEPSRSRPLQPAGGTVALLAVAVIALSASGAPAAEPPKAIVTSSDGTTVELDIGRLQGVTVDTRFRIYAPGRIIRIPLTGTKTYIEGLPVGIVRVTEVQDTSSKCIVDLVNPGAKIEQGHDAVYFSGPTAAPVEDAGTAEPTSVEVEIEPEKEPAGRMPLTSPGGRPLFADPMNPAPGQEVYIRVGGLEKEEGGYHVKWASSAGWLSTAWSPTSSVTWVAPRLEGEYSISALVTTADGLSVPSGGKIRVKGDPIVRKKFELEKIFDYFSYDGKKLSVQDMVFDGENNAYLLDYQMRCVLRQEPTGRITEFARRESCEKAGLRTPMALAIHGDKTYILDEEAPFIKLVDSKGNIIGVMGEDAGIGAAVDLAVDRRGRVYVVDAKQRCFHVFDAAGRYLQPRGRRGNDLGEFQRPVAIDIAPDGRLYVLDSGRKDVQVFDAHYNVVTNLSVRVTKKNKLLDIALAPDGRSFYVLEGGSAEPQVGRYSLEEGMLLYSMGNKDVFGNLPRVASRLAVDRLGRVHVMTRMKTRKLEGVFRYTADGRADARLSELTAGSPVAIAVSDSGGYAILDERSPHVRVHDPSGWLVERFGKVTDRRVPFRMPRRIAMTRRDGSIALLMPPQRRGGFERTPRVPALQVFDPWGEGLRYVGKRGKRAGEFLNACDLDTDRRGNVYVLDGDLFKISVFSSRGAGATPEMEREFARGRRRKHELGRPKKLAVDPDTRDFYVYDARSHEVKKFSESASFIGAVGKDLNFGSVRRITVDYLGFLWVFDRKDGQLRRIDFRGGAAAARLTLPLDEVEGSVIDFGLDASGRIYVLTSRDLVYVYH